jgi:hypothetical protein
MKNNDTFIFPDTISKMFNIRARTVRNKLRHFKDMLPPDATTLAPKGRPGPQIYILKRKYLQQFCKLAQISKSFTADSNYLTATDIAHILHSHHSQIYGLLTQYQHTMPPGAIQLQKHTTKYILVLHKDFLDMFCEIAGIQKSILKTPEWLNSREIARQLHIKHDKIPSILNDLYTQGTLPKSILQKRRCGKVTTIYLHKDYLQDFVTAAKLQTIQKKDDNWLSAKEIRQKTKRRLNNLPTMLHELRSQMPNGAIEFRKSGPKTHLCLNQEYMNDFCAITGLYIYDTKDDKIWIGARELEQMFHTHIPQMPQLLKEMQSKMPSGAIEYKKNSTRISPYLRRDYITEFLKITGLYETHPKIKKMLLMQEKTK